MKQNQKHNKKKLPDRKVFENRVNKVPLNIHSELPVLLIYTDGSCSRNPGGDGTWAFAIIEDEKVLYQASGYDKSTTNNRMEISAVLAAIAYINQEGISDQVIIHMDSSYVYNSCTGWLTGWARNSFLREGKDIPNKDLWEQVHGILSIQGNIQFKWVKGHVEGEVWNNYVDNLCKMAYKSPIEKKKSQTVIPTINQRMEELEKRMLKLESIVGYGIHR